AASLSNATPSTILSIAASFLRFLRLLPRALSPSPPNHATYAKLCIPSRCLPGVTFLFALEPENYAILGGEPTLAHHRPSHHFQHSHYFRLVRTPQVPQ